MANIFCSLYDFNLFLFSYKRLLRSRRQSIFIWGVSSAIYQILHIQKFSEFHLALIPRIYVYRRFLDLSSQDKHKTSKQK